MERRALATGNDRPARDRGAIYAFDNSAAQAPARLGLLAGILDAGTERHLTALGLGEGWRCLEVGGGAGSIAAWLCDRVGPAGRVVATDIDTRFLATLAKPNLEVRRHDIVSEPLPEAEFDLVHTRLVLMHLPDRDRVLSRLIKALKPGGWILAEEFDSLSIGPDPVAYPGESPCRALLALLEILAERGADLRYGRRLPSFLRALGLDDVSSEGRTFMWGGGSTGAELLRANFEQLRDAMLESGRITTAELARDLAHLGNPDFLVPSAILWASQGRRPAG